MQSTVVVRYLLVTSLGSGVLGVIHGAAAPPYDESAPAMHGLTGALLGPWAPILMPLWMAGVIPNCRCPVVMPP